MWTEAVFAAVERAEFGVSLEYEVSLAREPEARGLDMRQHGLGAVVGRRIRFSRRRRGGRGGPQGRRLRPGLLREKRRHNRKRRPQGERQPAGAKLRSVVVSPHVSASV